MSSGAPIPHLALLSSPKEGWMRASLTFHFSLKVYPSTDSSPAISASLGSRRASTPATALPPRAVAGLRSSIRALLPAPRTTASRNASRRVMLIKCMIFDIARKKGKLTRVTLCQCCLSWQCQWVADLNADAC